jgi:hypothetical protein
MSYKKLNVTAKLASYNARSRKSDSARLTEQFNGDFSQSHISNVLSGRRRNAEIINAAYRMASRRMKNSEIIAA